MVDPWLTKKRVERMKNDYWPKNFMLPKTIRFVWNNSYIGACVSVIGACVSVIGACVSVIMAWWPYAKFYFLVNRKIWLRIDQKNLQFTVDRRHYWPKVPNILCTYISKQNVHFPFHILSRLTKRTVNNCSSDSPNFHTYLCIQNIPLFCTFLDLQNVPL